MLDLLGIRNKIETAFEGFNFMRKSLTVSRSVNMYGEKLNVTMHDLVTDFYARYTIASEAGESEITVIDGNSDVVRTSHKPKVVLKAIINHMKEWGVDYDNTRN